MTAEESLLPELNSRVEKVSQGFTTRTGVYPISFTGSIDDLRQIASRSTRNGYRQCKFLSRDLDTFSDDQLNEWTKIFQEYWLTMFKTSSELNRLAADTKGEYKCALKADPPASKSFLSPGNLSFARLSLERILPIFEEDLSNASRLADRDATEQAVFHRLNFENKYLAKRLIQRPIVV